MAFKNINNSTYSIKDIVKHCGSLILKIAELDVCVV